jgi:glucose/arabinose dehydrogenase
MRLASLAGPVVAVLLFTSTARAQVCQGDCSQDATVTVDELVTIVSIALGTVDAGLCIVGDSTCDGGITVDEIVGSVTSALGGCGDAFVPRGELEVEASLAEGFLRQIPGGPAVGGTPRMPAQYRVDEIPEVEVRVFARNLEVPWALAFAPDGRLFITERPGRIRVVVDGVLDPQPWATVNINAFTQEGGLMGLAIDPQFEQEPWVYICYTTFVEGNIANRVSRLQQIEGGGVNEQILVDNILGASVHDGCRLKFGPDGMLYASTGDARQPAAAQRLDTLHGKILRIRPDGTIPADNPMGPTSYIYTYGHRNPQGLAFRSDGVLFETEHGPTLEVGGLRAHDEVNVIEAGSNYGWPNAVGAPILPEYRDPILMYPDTAVPPAGATFYESEAIAPWSGNFFFTSLGAVHLQRVVLDPCDRPFAIERLLVGSYGRLRDVIEGPDGNLYVATSNRDGRGRPTGDDDRILQIVAAD